MLVKIRRVLRPMLDVCRCMCMCVAEHIFCFILLNYKSIFYCRILNLKIAFYTKIRAKN